jgi:hypothetical protein
MSSGKMAVNVELELTLKEEIQPNSRHSLKICQEELRKEEVHTRECSRPWQKNRIEEDMNKS